MNYEVSKNVKVYGKNDKYLFINPKEGKYIRLSKNSKLILDKILNDEYTDNLYHNEKEKIIKMLLNNKILNIIKNTNNIKSTLGSISHKKLNSIYLILTKQCNMSCDFCITKSSPSYKDDLQLNTYQIQNIINKVQARSIILTGGEPLLRKDIIEICSMLKSKTSSKIVLQTNGLLLTDNIINCIQGKVDNIIISLENIFENLNQRQKISSILSKLQACGIKMSFSFVATSKNLQYIYDFIDICVKYNALISIKTVQPLGKAIENPHLYINSKLIKKLYLDIYEYVYKKQYFLNDNIYSYIFQRINPRHSCSACGNSITIQTNGDIYSCHSLSYSKFFLGNVLNQNFSVIWDNLLTKQCSNFYKKCFYIDERNICKDCNVKYFCGGACYANIYTNKDKNLLPLECEVNKIHINFYLWDYSPTYDRSFALKSLIKKF